MISLLLTGAAITSSAMAAERERVSLPQPRHDGTVSVEAALAGRRSLRDFGAGALSLADIGQLLWAAQGVTSADGGRTSPSAGALYPLEVYLVAGAVTGLPAGTYHYLADSHQLEVVASGDLRNPLARAALGQSWMRKAPAVIVIAAVHARTAAKYGTRARRYVHMEVGHAGQNVYLQAEALSLATVMVGAFDDDEVAALLKLPRGERPLGLMPVGRRR